ncbi:glucose-6-phosphate dehydrogenase [Ferruginibacter sp. SUN106]|uniref:glucose-6-phosphate dehydrogenase n=1 Tax=Ferruginibacter sp. SUN106 TaxID=2978348 RepID=UPI003D36FC10
MAKHNSIKHPAAIVIFGGTGDLTKRKLIPAFYNLFLSKHLPEKFTILLLGRNEDKNEQFKKDLFDGIAAFSRNGTPDDNNWKIFSSNIFYQQGNFLDNSTFVTLKEHLDAFDKKNKQRCLRTFYLAIAPQFIEPSAEGLYKNKICNQVKLDRIVVEKPFGTDLATAQKLNTFLQKRFSEKQIFRIDHYLGKETVQNIMAFRFANTIFSPVWNNKYIDHVEISLSEQVSIGKRGGYYDGSGALRDMIQNHLLQLLCVVAMECPGKYDEASIRNAKAAVLKKIKPYTEAEVFKNIVRAQYTSGTINEQPQQGYLQEENITPSSTTETFIAGKFFINNERWKGVPFFLATGKCLPKQASVIMIQFKDSPYKIFKDDTVPNRLLISIQPEQEISLLFESKVPGVQMKLKPVEMDFTYKESYTEATPEAYETLLLDVLDGDATLFMRSDQVEAAWKVVMPIINAWKKNPKKQLLKYAAGTWGPTAATSLLKPYAKNWVVLPATKKS